MTMATLNRYRSQRQSHFQLRHYHCEKNGDFEKMSE